MCIHVWQKICSLSGHIWAPLDNLAFYNQNQQGIAASWPLQRPIDSYEHPNGKSKHSIYMGVSIVMGVPQKWWVYRENPIKMDDYGVPLF